MRSVVILTLICFVFSCETKRLKVYYNITDEEYARLPVLFHLDNFDACMSQNPALYCYTTIQLRPNDDQHISDTWRNIQELIETPRTYRHDRLRHGVCVPLSCPLISTDVYANGNATDDLWKELSSHYSIKYQHLGLKGEVSKIYCQDRKDIYAVDYLDVVYGIIILCLILTVVTGTVYDKCTAHCENSHSSIRRIMMAFSLSKNWERLTTKSTNDLTNALMPVQGIRVYNTVFVIMSHTAMINLMGPIQNAEYTEDSTLNPAIMFLSNGSLICQTNFLISAWLLSYSFFSMFENKKVTFGSLANAFLHRYYRLAPTIILAVGFSATWLRHFGNGPVWHHYVNDEFNNCRNNWWLNLLFLNNYVNTGELCLQQSWYIACEMQCFIIGLFIMMVVINNPKLVNGIFISAIILGILISIGHNYHMDYDIVYRSYSETIYTMYLESAQWTDTFVAGHIAFPAYAQGLFFGYYFYKFRKAQKKIILEKVTFVIWTFLSVLFPIGTILIAYVFYQEGFECTRFQAALYQGLYRYFFALTIGQFIFVFVFGGGGFMLPLVTWSPFQILARTTFSIYLTHVWLMRMRYGIQRTPTYITNFTLVGDYLADLILSLIIGTLTCLMVEMPLSALDKVIFSSRMEVKREDKTK